MDKAAAAMKAAEERAARLIARPRAELTTDAERAAWAVLDVACPTCRAGRGHPCRSGRGVVKPCAPHAWRRQRIDALRRMDAIG